MNCWIDQKVDDEIEILSKFLFIYLIIKEMKSSRVKLTYEKKKISRIYIQNVRITYNLDWIRITFSFIFLLF